MSTASKFWNKIGRGGFGLLCLLSLSAMKLDDFDPKYVNIEDQRGKNYYLIFDLVPIQWFRIKHFPTKKPIKFCSYHINPAKSWCTTIQPHQPKDKR